MKPDQETTLRPMSARREIGLRHLTGDGVPKRPEIALEYLAKYADEPEVLVALAVHLPLDVLIRSSRLDLLERAQTSSEAADKLEIWRFLSAGGKSSGCLKDQRGFQLLATLERQAVSSLLLEAYERLPDHLGHLLKVAELIGAHPEIAASKLVELLCAAEAGHASLGALSSTQIHSMLTLSVRTPYADSVLGRAQIGFSCGSISWEQLVPKLNYRAGYAHLLRAADQGECRAWYYLYLASSDYRSVLANLGAAQFFLEKAAACGHVPSQTILGAKTLQAAKTVHELQEGQRWLCRAWEHFDEDAGKILMSFCRVPSTTPSEEVASVLAKIAPLDPLLSSLLRAARAFGLTRKETFGLTSSSIPIHSHSLIFAPERKNSFFALPATDHEQREALRELSLRINESPPADGVAFERRRAAVQRSVFETYRFDENDFFVRSKDVALEHRDLSRWKIKNSTLLKAVVSRKENAR